MIYENNKNNYFRYSNFIFNYSNFQYYEIDSMFKWIYEVE